jgi:hypothetical protein
MQKSPPKKTKLHKRPKSQEEQDDGVHGDGVEGVAGGGNAEAS